MVYDLSNFTSISRQDWQQLHRHTTPLLTSEELGTLSHLSNQLDLKEIKDIYLPLINLIKIYQKNVNDLALSKSLFLKSYYQKRPFIIGISGSVAVGKSTTSQLLQQLLRRSQPDDQIDLVTTDGFLYPNQTLIDKGILNRKGFPESYDMPRLLDFLDKIKNGKAVNVPIYSHKSYDIVADEVVSLDSPDILIIEGINVFQYPQHNCPYMADYFDFSIYIDAEAKHIEHWYLERFSKLLLLAKKDPDNYYHRFIDLPPKEALGIAKHTWETINLVNLKNHIQPSRNRVDLILHKSYDHKIDKIYLKK